MTQQVSLTRRLTEIGLAEAALLAQEGVPEADIRARVIANTKQRVAVIVEALTAHIDALERTPLSD